MYDHVPGYQTLVSWGVQSAGIRQQLRRPVTVVSQAAVVAGDAAGQLPRLDLLALVIVVDAQALGFVGTPDTQQKASLASVL